MELRQLRYFVTIAQEGQITRAAEKLHLAQPALSQRVAQLESQLGVALFHRHARGVSLTPPGEAYLAKVQVALTALADAELTVRALSRAASPEQVAEDALDLARLVDSAARPGLRDRIAAYAAVAPRRRAPSPPSTPSA